MELHWWTWKEHRVSATKNNSWWDGLDEGTEVKHKLRLKVIGKFLNGDEWKFNWRQKTATEKTKSTQPQYSFALSNSEALTRSTQNWNHQRRFTQNAFMIMLRLLRPGRFIGWGRSCCCRRLSIGSCSGLSSSSLLSSSHVWSVLFTSTAASHLVLFIIELQ